MNSSLLFGRWLGVLLLLAGALAGRAQSIVAGQTTGVSYMDIAPDKAVPDTGGRLSELKLDLDNDGRPDFTFSYYIQVDYYNNTYYTWMRPLHTDAAVMTTTVLHPYAPYAAYALYAFGTGELINSTAPTRIPLTVQPGGTAANAWQDSTYQTGNPGPNLICHIRDRGPEFTTDYGLWKDSLEHYAGFRLRASSNSPWQYGWIRLSLQNHLTLKDYAWTGTALPTTSPPSTTEWQVYPTTASDHLMVAIPAPAKVGQLTVRDLCGRQLLQIALTEQKQRIAITSLTAGIYLLELKTADTRTTQRILKQ